jgi:DNA polymerase-3 subunit alpha
MGIVVLPPDVNESEIDFTVVYDEQPDPDITRKKDKPVSRRGRLYDPYKARLRFGLGAVKGVGSSALESILAARCGDNASDGLAETRAFGDLFDFAARVDLRKVNKTAVEALVQCGAFGTSHGPMGVNRAQAFAAIDAALERGRKLHAERNSGQTNLLSLLTDESRPQTSVEFPKAVMWDDAARLVREKNILGFYVSGHPLDRYSNELKRFCTANTSTLGGFADGKQVTMAGTVEGYRERTSRAGGKIAFFQLEDPHGRVEVIVRARSLDQVRDALTSNDAVLVTGTVQYEHSEGNHQADDLPESRSAPVPKLLLQEACLLADSLQQRARGVRIRLEAETLSPGQLEQLRQTLERHPGTCPVQLELWSTQHWSVSLPIGGLRVEPSEALKTGLQALFGHPVCELH